MKKKNTLSVKPLRKYNTPVYPSYLDKNPIEHPDTLPYPFSYKALQVLAGAGILVGASCSPTKKGSNNLPTTQQEIVQDSLANPFVFENLGVPYMPASFGTGLPARLQSEEARETINKVFQEEGIKLEENYHYEKNDINVKLDGYDAQSQIGYVWVDYKAMGQGMARAMGTYYHYYSQAKNRILGSSNFTVDIKIVKSFMARFIGNEMSWDVIDAYTDRFNKIDELADDNEKIAVYKELYLDMLILKEQQRDKSDQFASHINENSSYQEKETVYVNWELKRKFEKIARNIPQKETVNKIFDSILEIEEETLKEKRHDDLMNFLSPYSEYAYNRGNPKPDSLFTDDIQQMEKNISDYVSGYSDDKIALREAQKIDSLPKIDGDFIAPIGQRDNRFAYQDFYDLPQLTEKQEKKLAKIKETQGEHAYMKAYREFINAAEKRDPKDEALKRLETQVRQYIRWAKQQSGY